MRLNLIMKTTPLFTKIVFFFLTILLTSFSTLNKTNIDKFKKLLTKESYVITLSYFYKKNKLQYFRIISQKNHGLLKLFLLKIK